MHVTSARRPCEFSAVDYMLHLILSLSVISSGVCSRPSLLLRSPIFSAVPLPTFCSACKVSYVGDSGIYGIYVVYMGWQWRHSVSNSYLRHVGGVQCWYSVMSQTHVLLRSVVYGNKHSLQTNPGTRFFRFPQFNSFIDHTKYTSNTAALSSVTSPHLMYWTL